MLKSVLLLLSGNAFGSLFSLIRNLLVARLISVEDYGIASTFAISMTIVELVSTMGLQQLIVQDKSGNDPKFQAALQGFHLIRGVLAAAILFFAAGAIASFLGIPEVAWAYQVLAIVPLANGFTHFDMFRRQRQMAFLPFILSNTVPPMLSVLVVLPLNAWLGDYRVMLYAVIVHQVGIVAGSQLTSERRYKLAFSSEVMKRSLSFGWPLLINNMLLFAVLQGEKVIVGREMGMALLAVFAMGFTLTLTPTLVVAKSIQSFFLPQLSATEDDPARFNLLSMATLQASLLNGIILIGAIAVIGPYFIHAVLGEKYAGIVPFLLWLALLQAARSFKIGTATVALARARNSNAMIGNSFRAASLGISWYIAATSGNLLAIIIVGTLAELIGYAVTLRLLVTRLSVDLRPMIAPIAVTGVLMLLSVAALIVHPGGEMPYPVVMCLVGMTVTCILSQRELLIYLRSRTMTQFAE